MNRAFHLVIFAIALLFSFACADIQPSTDVDTHETADTPDDSDSEEIGRVDQSLVDALWCATHHVGCLSWCYKYPSDCATLCAANPLLDVCTNACVSYGATCLDEEEPGYVPCCTDAGGGVQCFNNFSTGYECAARRTNPPGCRTNGQSCTSSSQCCQDSNPFAPPFTCQGGFCNN